MIKQADKKNIIKEHKSHFSGWDNPEEIEKLFKKTPRNRKKTQ